MPTVPTDTLSATFQALADPTRRAILTRLASGARLGHGVGQAVRYVDARHFQASESFGTGGPGPPRPLGPVAPLPARGPAAEKRRPVGSISTANSGKRVSIGWKFISSELQRKEKRKR